MARYDKHLGDRVVTVRMTVAELDALLSAAQNGQEDEAWFECRPDEVSPACERAIDKGYEALCAKTKGRDLCENCGVRAACPRLHGRLIHHYTKEPMPVCEHCVTQMGVESAQEDERDDC